MSRDRQWLQFCIQGAQTFKRCSRAQYFAVVVDVHGHVLGTGYNGVPKGMTHCTDGGCPRAQLEGAQRGTDYTNCLAIHAEANALLHSDYSARHGGTLYVNGVPCWDCAKLIANSGLARVVFLYEAVPMVLYDKVTRLLREAGVAWSARAD